MKYPITFGIICAIAILAGHEKPILIPIFIAAGLTATFIVIYSYKIAKIIDYHYNKIKQETPKKEKKNKDFWI